MNFKQAAVGVFILAAILMAINGAVKSVDPSTIPEGLETVWAGVSWICGTQAAVVGFTFLSNIWGYVEHYIASDTGIQYEGKKLAETWAQYERYIMVLSPAVMVATQNTPFYPYAEIFAGAVSFVVIAFRKSLKDISGAKT